MKKSTAGGTVKRVLLHSAPFLLIPAAIYLLILWALEGFVEKNIYFRVATLAPDLGGNTESERLILTEEDKEILKENNKGDAFSVTSDFPPIALGEQWATITIESAGVYDIPVLHGDNSDNLWKGVGHYANSRFPGQRGKVVIAGHVGIYQHFQRLETMNIGDIVTLNTIYGDYVYRVTDTAIFDENDSSLILPEENETEDKLICYTCYPYYTTSVRTQRFAIICELVSGKDWTVKAAEENGVPDTSGDNGSQSAVDTEVAG